MRLCAFALVLTGAAGCSLTHTRDLGCHWSSWGLKCPDGQIQTGGSCGWWRRQRECVTSSCCVGWGGPACTDPVCSGGCGNGRCAAPGTCTCDAGFTGTTCSKPVGGSALAILSINFACRDVAQLSGCDNCKTRFDLIASAFRGGTGFAGVPNLDEVDVVLAQELGTSQANFAQITAALAASGFTHTTGAPAPTASDPQCSSPPGTFSSLETKAAFSALSGLESGGLVTFSKHPILTSAQHNWCAHNLPAPAGYLSTLLSVGGTSALVVNAHMFPEYDFGVEAADVRTYQFSELSAFADAAEAALRATGAPFVVVIAGDLNEDAYGLASSTSERRCDVIAAAAATKLAAVSLDVRAACAAGAIGTPTWDPTANDLAGRFSDGDTHEVLDYIIRHSSSETAAAPAAPNHVDVLKATSKWSGTFCSSSILGTAGPTYQGEANALTDHSTVTATLALSDAPADPAAAAASAAAFEAMLRSWRSDAGAQEAACGQSGAGCWADKNCCEARFSWDGVEQICGASLTCAACVPLGGSCASTILHPEGSPCCGYDDFGSGTGAHCELTLNGPICVPKLEAGNSCLWDEECDSRDCALQWWPPGKFCK